MPRLHHFDDLQTARAVNFTCYHRYPLLTDRKTILIFLNEIAKVREKYSFGLLGYVVMPTHVHLVLLPPDGIRVGTLIGEIKSRSARRILYLWRTERNPFLRKLRIKRRGEETFVFWQARCYDHNCRTIEAVREIINYCHMNPVKAGFVSSAHEWKWSSYRWYYGYNDIAIEIDSIDLI